ncbi:hypothetical protein EXIGLDRAFT_87873 [Exidia glandulosa HHB12029]|uniref:Uncharacterized protein n=1 Tax=Exidia glandulosa HHB12029 TaxID=1314781 RepID=A0A165NTD6_EXIGL|nr:hypothetical protein EXIGLDRAFT_87873 [Exidia glandulosa HHB12029]
MVTLCLGPGSSVVVVVVMSGGGGGGCTGCPADCSLFLLLVRADVLEVCAGHLLQRPIADEAASERAVLAHLQSRQTLHADRALTTTHLFVQVDHLAARLLLKRDVHRELDAMDILVNLALRVPVSSRARSRNRTYADQVVLELLVREAHRIYELEAVSRRTGRLRDSVVHVVLWRRGDVRCCLCGSNLECGHALREFVVGCLSGGCGL